MKLMIFAAGVSCLLCTMPALAQQSAATKSAFCEKFDHKSPAVIQKTMVIPFRDGSEGGKVLDEGLNSTFKFETVLQAILARTGSQQTPAALLQTMLESFRKTAGEERQPKSDLRMVVDARGGPDGTTGEAALTTANLLASVGGDDALFPIGLFNRFDLASAKSGNCGEARIVYSKAAQQGRRFLIIFEGKVTPQGGEAGSVTLDACRPVAEFWASLADKQGVDRVDTLKKFYFEGDMGSFGNLANPPMSMENLGGSDRGQVRGNLFVNGEWQLREWLLRKHGDRLTFDVVTVKDNPLAEFYKNGSTFLEPERGKAEMADFQKAFAKDMIQHLAAALPPADNSAVGQLPLAIKTVHSFGFGPGSTASFDEFQSTSQAFSDVVLANTSASNPSAIVIDDTFKAQITAAKPAGSTVDVSHIINRAMALTCQGCHQPGTSIPGSPGGATRGNFELEIAPAAASDTAVKWPASLNFVHINEDSKLSPALLESFLPFRAAVLKDELCRGPQTPVDPKIAEYSGRKAASTFRLARPSVQTLRTEAAEADNVVDRNAIQETLNTEEEVRRATERAQPGTYWPLRRTH